MISFAHFHNLSPNCDNLHNPINSHLFFMVKYCFFQIHVTLWKKNGFEMCVDLKKILSKTFQCYYSIPCKQISNAQVIIPQILKISKTEQKKVPLLLLWSFKQTMKTKLTTFTVVYIIFHQTVTTYNPVNSHIFSSEKESF